MKSVFRPLNRVLVDVLIATNVALFIASALGLFKIEGFLFCAVPISLFETFIWFVIIRNLFSVTITEDNMAGPNPYFFRTSIPLANLHRARSEERSRMSIWWGYRDFFSKDLKNRIRLWRRLLGRRQIYKIWQTLGWGNQPGGSKPLIYYPPYGK